MNTNIFIFHEVVLLLGFCVKYEQLATKKKKKKTNFFKI